MSDKAFENDWYRFVTGLMRAAKIDAAKTYRLEESRPPRNTVSSSVPQYGRYQTTTSARPYVQALRNQPAAGRLSGPTAITGGVEERPVPASRASTKTSGSRESTSAAQKPRASLIWSSGPTEEEKRKWAAKMFSPEKPIVPSDDREHRNADGVCVYMKDAKGNVVFTPEYAELACKNYNALQEGATKTNDGLTAVALAGRKIGGRTGEILGDGATFGTFVSSLSTGSGFNPFGIPIIPKSPPPAWCTR
jgi:hypothetical protein